MVKEILENSGFFYVDILPKEKKIIKKIIEVSKNYFNNKENNKI